MSIVSHPQQWATLLSDRDTIASWITNRFRCSQALTPLTTALSTRRNGNRTTSLPRRTATQMSLFLRTKCGETNQESIAQWSSNRLTTRWQGLNDPISSKEYWILKTSNTKWNPHLIPKEQLIQRHRKWLERSNHWIILSKPWSKDRLKKRCNSPWNN